jgi:DNA polymerase eta
VTERATGGAAGQVGAKICARLRGVVRRELGYSMSGGVAANKLLAKLASAMHKPNQQTVIPLRAVAGLMRELPLTKIGKMGGKVSECTTQSAN